MPKAQVGTDGSLKPKHIYICLFTLGFCGCHPASNMDAAELSTTYERSEGDVCSQASADQT